MLSRLRGSRPVRSSRPQLAPGVRGLAGCRSGDAVNPVSYSLAARGINLPSALMLSEADVDRVLRRRPSSGRVAPAVRPPPTRQGP